MDLTNGWYPVRRTLEGILDALFARSGVDVLEFDSILSVDDMNALGYARNFPHLTCLMCSLAEDQLVPFSRGEKKLARRFQAVNADFALLPATCYKVYLGLRNASLTQETRVGCIAKCFRHEDKPLDAYRALNFTMKEFVYLGSAEGAQAHLEDGAGKIDDLTHRLGLECQVDVASDPFFDGSGSVALMSKLDPTKREILFDGHAVSSLNYHRNYFGEKFDIRYQDRPVHTSCVAFGLERWVSMLDQRFGSASAAAAALEAVAADVVGRGAPGR